MEYYFTREMIDYSHTRSVWMELKQGEISLRRMLTSLIGLLRLVNCLFVRLEVVNLWAGWFLACEGEMEAY